MLTQKELAKRIGVSQQAISFALNGGGTLKQATRDFIIEEAQKAGYRVNSASRLFREGKTNQLALIVQGNFHALPGIMLSAMRTVLREHDMHLTLFGAEDDDFADSKNPPRLVRELSVDGFLILYDGRRKQLLEQINQYRIPSVWINQKQDVNAVYPDDYSNAKRAVHELVQMNKGHAVYVSPKVSSESHYSVHDRRDGFLSAAQELGLSHEVFELHREEMDCDEKHLAMKSLLTRRKKRPTVILTYGVEEAEALYVQAALLGFKIPQDLVICCFSMHRAQVGFYGMTRIFIPIHVTGKEAVKMLLNRIKHPGKNFPSVAVDHFTLHKEPGPAGFYAK